MTPEQQARQQIDAQLVACGWVIQDYTQFNPAAAHGIALREVPLKSGQCDYLLLVDRKPVGVIEAKKEGTLLSGVAEQTAHYAVNLPAFFKVTRDELPFLYESTGVETFFRNTLDPEPRSRHVFAFHKPETLVEWASQADTLRAHLAKMPVEYPLVKGGMRDCQFEGITHLEQSFAAAHPRALIQMATGAGKTYAACAFTYRLIKHAGAKRVLFLVDRANLGRKAMAEFQQFVTPDTGRKFTELYNVQHLTSNQLDSVARVTICTIQRLYSMLRGEELDEDIDEKSGFELAAADDRPRDVAYNPAIPIETFDFIVTDECHRSIYNLWRQVLEYFDAFLIGLTATPSKQTIGFFDQNLVMEYNHERAVADGVNVGYEVYRIRTQVTEQGGKVEKGYYVDKRSKETRKRRWEQLDEDLTYAAQELDCSVVVPSQIRTVLQAFKDALFTELFPGRTLVPKTLIFCKDDSHAEDVVHLVREVFGKGNDFAKKITYKTYNPETKRYEKSETLIQEFRTSPQLRIAVTVDMIATGTDIKPLECLLFLRDVRSRVYFEQMKGRGTRVLTPTDLQAVSGADARAKTHFIVVDAVGVCESDKTDSRPLERQRTVAFDKLMLGVALGKRDEDTLTTLAGRIARLDREVTAPQRKELAALADGKTLAELSATLLRAIDPDVITEQAAGKPGASPADIAPDAFEAARQQLITAACAPFDSPALRDALAKAKQESEQTIDTVTIDIVTHHDYDDAAKEKAANLLKSFRDYIEQHRAEITALQILYSRPYRQRLTETMLKELEKKLRDTNATWNEENLWNACAAAAPGKVKGRSVVNRFADLVP
ncbi:MAG: DEAD/DEAH box helicase family protein, partial [Betaproteobacteria bacterium]|nr:DEAD/DEAH box helicase family protein [Betaproteobacteria bacterium]